MHEPGTQDRPIPVSLAGLDGVVDLEILDAPGRRALYMLQDEGALILIPLRRGFVGLVGIGALSAWDELAHR